MTKKYIAFKDEVLPINGYTSTDEGKIAKVVNDSGSYKLEVVEAGQASIGWADVTAKPFSTIGTGLTVVADALTANTQFKFQIFPTLPTPSATYAQTIALVSRGTSETGNLYDEFACVEVSAGSWSWEKIGSTDFTLNIQQTATGITINDTALQTATSTRTGLLATADYNTFAGKQDALTFDDTPTTGSSNPVKSGGVFTALGGKVDKETGKALIETSKVNSYDTHIADGSIHVTTSDKTAWNGKQSALSGTSGNVVIYTGTAGSLGSLGFDETPTSASNNLIKSGAIKTALDSKQNTLTFDNVPTASSSNPVKSGGVYSALSGKVAQDSTSSVAFVIGCDSTGLYADY